MKKLVFFELRKVFAGLICTMFSMLILSVWRQYDSKTFLFIQIVSVTIFSYILFLRIENKAKYFSGNSMVAALISFTLLTSLALNIDRSRSVLVIKWVYQLSSHSTTNIDEIASFKNLTLNEIPAIEQRLKEQSEIGLLREQTANYSLSLAGKLFIAIANFLSNMLKLNGYRLG